MNLPNRQRLGAVVLIISGIAAFVAPFLIHSPPTQGNIGPGPDNGNNGGNDGTGGSSNPGGGGTGGGGGHGAGPRKSMQDLMNAVGSCEADNHGAQMSLMAKVRSAMRADTSTRTDHHLAVLEHQLETPAAEKHAGACISDLKSLIDELLPS